MDLERLDAAFARLRRLWDSPAIKRRYLELLGRDVELSLIRTLQAIEWAGDEPGVRHVAETLHVDGSTASRFVDQAVATGWVTRTTSRRDRRCCVLALTEEGARLLNETTAVRTALLGELTAGWPPEDVTALSVLLERFACSIFEREFVR